MSEAIAYTPNPAPSPMPPAGEQFLSLEVSASGDTDLVPAQENRHIVVSNVLVISAGTVSMKFKSGSTDITGSMDLIASSGFGPGLDRNGHFRTAINEALKINLSGGVKVAGWIKYHLA